MSVSPGVLFDPSAVSPKVCSKVCSKVIAVSPTVLCEGASAASVVENGVPVLCPPCAARVVAMPVLSNSQVNHRDEHQCLCPRGSCSTQELCPRRCCGKVLQPPAWLKTAFRRGVPRVAAWVVAMPDLPILQVNHCGEHQCCVPGSTAGNTRDLLSGRCCRRCRGRCGYFSRRKCDKWKESVAIGKASCQSGTLGRVCQRGRCLGYVPGHVQRRCRQFMHQRVASSSSQYKLSNLGPFGIWSETLSIASL